MPSLNDIADVKEVPVSDEHIPQPEPQPEAPRNNFFGDLLTAETGEGSIEDYLDHPMNFNNSKSMARILRGMTGIIGNLRLAIVDIGIGLLEFTRERKTFDNIGTDESINPRRGM